MLKEKSILFTCAKFGGGVGKMIRYVSSVCVSEFNSVSLLHRGREGEINISNSHVKEVMIPRDSRENFIIWRFKQIVNIRRVIKVNKPDIVCCFGSEQAVMVAIAMLGITRTKLIQCDRCDPYTISYKWKYLTKWAFSQADGCVFQLEKQMNWYGKSVVSKSFIIPNAFLPTSDYLKSVSSREKTIVSVGRFVPQKRYDVLIKTFKKVHEKYSDFKLIIYGDGPLRQDYEELVRTYHLENFVIMPGYIENVMESIRSAGLFVLSSAYEGIPNSLIEAMAAGIPTVSTDCSPGGPDFLTDHGRRGLLVPVDDVDAMFLSICQIIENPELAEKLGCLGREIISLLDEKRISSKWIDCFNKVLSH